MRKGKIEKLSKTIEKLLAARGWSAKLHEYRIFGIWDKAVGAGIARHARPSAIRGGKLTVIVDSSAWMQQLSLLKPEIVGKLNARLGENAVNGLTLRLGEIELAAPSAPEYQPPTGSIGPDERARIESVLAGISDPEVRESLRRVVEKDLLSRKGPGKRAG